MEGDLSSDEVNFLLQYAMNDLMSQGAILFMEEGEEEEEDDFPDPASGVLN